MNCRIALKFDRHIGSTAAEVPVEFQSDRTILNTILAASRLYEILRKDVFSDIETGPWLLALHVGIDVTVKGGGVHEMPTDLNRTSCTVNVKSVPSSL